MERMQMQSIFQEAHSVMMELIEIKKKSKSRKFASRKVLSIQIKKKKNRIWDLMKVTLG